MPNTNAFTLDEINQILEQLNSHPGARLQYIGSRYVPVFGRKGEDSIEWDNTGTYEPLTIVLYQGNSYTSRQFVPAGIEITNVEYWAKTGNYNAQIEQYRQEVAQVAQQQEGNTQAIAALQTGLSDESANRLNADNALQAQIDQNGANVATTITDAAKSQLASVVVTDAETFYLDRTRANYAKEDDELYATSAEKEAFGVQAGSTWYLPALGAEGQAKSGNPIGAALVAGSFLNNNIVYGRDNGVFNTATPARGAQQMVCSDLVWATLIGCEYAASKFVSDYNTPGQFRAQLPANWKSNSKLAPVEKTAWITREIAAAFAAMGKLYKVNNINAIMPGDILFNTQPDLVGNDYLGIGHCAIVVDVNPSLQEAFIVQCGATSQNLLYDFSENTGTIGSSSHPMFAVVDLSNNATCDYYAARPNWSDIKPRMTNHQSGKQESVSIATPTSVIFTITPENELKTNDLFVIKLHCDDFAKISITRSQQFRILVSESSTLTQNNSLTRYYQTASRAITGIPATIVLYGFVNANIASPNTLQINSYSDDPISNGIIEWEFESYSL